jgi:hypothetical protein
MTAILDRLPFEEHDDEGMAVHDERLGVPRLPLLGMRALVRNNLFLLLDSEQRHLHLRTSDWRTMLLRWLA